jgi:hypothetical protein
MRQKAAAPLSSSVMCREGKVLMTERKEIIGKRLFKYWPKEHVENALYHGIIRLGTFWGYQEIETKQSQDRNEGHPGFAFEVMEDMLLPANLFNQVVGEGPEHQQYKLLDPWKIDLKKGTRLLVKAPFNFPIFCLSISEKPDLGLMNEFGAPDPDVLEIVDYKIFTNEVAKQVLKEFERTLNDPAVKIFGKPESSQYEVEARADIVQYLKKERMIIPIHSDEDLEFDRVIAGMEFFKKEEQFSFQKEFRIVVMLKIGNQFAAIQGKPLTIKLDNPQELLVRPTDFK